MDNNQTIQETRNYSKFQFITANRETGRGHIEALKRAFEETGNLTRVQPILINEKDEIIDGQHRFVAAMELGEPVYFTVVPGLGVREARSMNILHRNWTIEDFAQSYADSGDPNYQRYLKLREDYGFSHSITLAYCKGRDERGMFAEFRNGEFTLNSEGDRQARVRLDMLLSTSQFVPMYKEKWYAMALLRMINVEGYEHRRMLRKLASHAETHLRRFGAIADYVRTLEDIYNLGYSDGNRVRFF